MQDDETQNPGAEAAGDDEIEMPPEPASVDAARTRVEVAWIEYTSAVDKVDAAAAAAFDAHVQHGAVDNAWAGAADVHNTLQAAEKEAHDRAAGLDAAADAASLATDDALRAELEARDAYTKAIAEGDDAAIEAAWNAVENLTTLTDAHKATRDGLRAAADAAAKDAEFADDVEDAAAEVVGPLKQEDIRAEMAVDAYEAAHAEAARAADAAREAYNQAIDAEEAVRQAAGLDVADDAAALDAAGLDVADDSVEDALRAADDVTKAAAREAAAADAADAAQVGSTPWSDDESGPSAADVEHIEMPPEPAREQAKPPGSEAPPIKGDASSRLMDGGGGASPIEDLRDEAFSGEEEGEGAPDVAAAAAPPAAVQEPNNAPDPVAASPEELGQDAPAADPWGDAAKLGGSEGLGQEQPSGEGPTAAPTEQGGSPFFGVDETGPPAGDVFDHEQATAEGVEIEMPPDYVGQASVDAGGGEIEIPPDPAETETPPEDHFEEGF